ncbi:hypothetical protein [Mucilaginibacter lappiensis]|uniref:Uncharacterized protein n=1 Tax=Mucilaginibacter lappiensis TaxID=354630 RepID=A0A1N7DXK0_9SPHI|nr:hypothetical protein [Mucilaginibacter lappiensis]MBB6111510.1 hypothetical protein [Mucilaginibacter lappiensis]MBB6130126.1 hypothetical protein [Mucilaginibacter lappiensis]SIR80501.1 hypothetical protein SAMN05421821_112132 [Mucilaginibacter lappiensis]
MKNHKTPSASKLIARFENQLLDILLEDFRNFRAKNSKQRVTTQQTLSVA